MIMMETSVLYSQLMLAFMAFKPSANWTGAVVDFLVDDVLTNGGFNTVPSSLSSVMDQLLSVLQTIIGLLPGERQRQVLHALFTVTASSSPSATGKQQKRAVCGFLCRLIDRHLGHWKDLAVFEKAGQEINRMASTFISMLPRQLWDMANDQQQHQQKQQSADNIVQFMHRIVTAAGALRCQQNAALHAILNAAHLSVDQLMETLQLAMVPLFQYYSAKQGRLFRGPISRLPVSTQRNLRSIIALMMPSVHPKLLQAIQPIDPIDANIIY
jgi:hypothetical protein